MYNHANPQIRSHRCEEQILQSKCMLRYASHFLFLKFCVPIYFCLFNNLKEKNRVLVLMKFKL